MSTVLERQQVECDGGVVLNKAQELGHEELLNKVRRMVYDPYTFHRRFMPASPTAGQIEEAIASLGIEPYTEYSVRKYKEKIEAKLFWRNIPVICAEVFVPLAVMTTLLVTPCWIILASILTICGITSAPMGVAGIVIICLFILGIATALSMDKGIINKKVSQWSTQEFQYYNLESVPDFALQTAVDLSERCPGITLYIEECHIDKEMVDPFLVVASGPSQWYLEVWNEPGFKKPVIL